ncbi:MAG: hypothetical protein SCARUB_01345 [Candidatus Scalindua rubra]|uniref:Uncharacterized protein n=1 Tax=Candidatus Scalindua rubra TaxID=1872076 RepID=A0A1E3XD03_9BACT|nr:MAG: hypothetical protein SCARUB_01345 [Candidatus Scalindua rubra]
MPSPNEMQVLRIAEDAKKVNKSVISRRMEITTIYADYLLATLAMKNHLQKARQGKYGVYKLTPKGREVLSKIRLVKWVGAREREVLKLVSELRRASPVRDKTPKVSALSSAKISNGASTNVISRKLKISNDYALLICKSLAGLDLRAAYLKEIKPCVYKLTALGEQFVAKKR